MRKRILLAISLLLVFGLAAVAFAYNSGTPSSDKRAMSCCCKDGVCPLKGKDQTGKENVSCCDMEDCCCKNGSCPMKNKDENKTADKQKHSCCDKKHDAKNN